MKEFFSKHKNFVFIMASALFFVIVGYIIMFTPLGTVAAGKNIELMDGKWFYPKSYVMETLTALGEQGRAEYTTFHIIDFFFLASYCLVMMSLTKLVAPAKMRWAWVVFPLIPATFDLVENTMIEVAIASFPNVSNGLSSAISIFTTIKWSTGILWFAVFNVLLILNIIELVRKYRKAKKERELKENE